jgi:2-polyprenyl-6-methoxyphenol hydroxylase-like FAD-dependent oxidoreductase
MTQLTPVRWPDGVGRTTSHARIASPTRYSTPVVGIVGAGPAGLTAACLLRLKGIDAVVFDGRPRQSSHSRALLWWPATLDVLAELGLGDRLRARAVPLRRFRYYSAGRQVTQIRFGESTNPLCLPQWAAEEELLDALRRLGGRIEWGCTVTDIDCTPDGARLTVRDPIGARRTLAVDWLVGADGAHSTVRDRLGIDFVGETYPRRFMLADARVAGSLAIDEVCYYQNTGNILAIVALPEERFRFFVNLPDGETASLELLQRLVDERGPGDIRLLHADCLSTFEIHQRTATRLSRGRCFLIGDAAHIHSPAGGQGLNTGVQDAHNLAWKLAAVCQGTADPALLDSYHLERHRVARTVVRDTDLQTRAWLVSGAWKTCLRDGAFRIAHYSGVADGYIAFRMAGNRLTYPTSIVTTRRRGDSLRHRHRVRAGTRFPRRVLEAISATQPAGGNRFQLITFATGASDPIAEAAHSLSLSLEALVEHRHVTTTVRSADEDCTTTTAIAQLACSPACFYLVRPDGFVAAHGTRAELWRAEDLLRDISARPRRKPRGTVGSQQPGNGRATPTCAQAQVIRARVIRKHAERDQIAVHGGIPAPMPAWRRKERR